MSTPRRRRTLALLAVAVLAAGVGIAFRALDLLPRLELAAVDARFDVKGASTPRPRSIPPRSRERERCSATSPFTAASAQMLNVACGPGMRTID